MNDNDYQSVASFHCEINTFKNVRKLIDIIQQ